MQDRSGIEELEAWFVTLAPRAELVARMALRMRASQVRDDKSYFARIAALIKVLALEAEDLNSVRADADRVAASLGDVGWTELCHEETEAPDADDRPHRRPG